MSGGPDWGDGEYEVFAPELVPAAELLLQLAAPVAGERAIDLGCGSGNVTLPLLRSGAVVTAVDPSLRLLGVTTELAKADGFELAPVNAGAESLPLPDGDADLIVSNFGLIFCPQPEAAFAELVRVLAPGGRALYTAWLPDGALADVAKLIRAAVTKDDESPDPARAVLSARELPGNSPGVVWFEPDSFSHLIPGGADAISVHAGAVTFRAPSAAAWVDSMAGSHPMWLAAQRAIEPARFEQFRTDAIELLAQSEIEDGTLAIHSPYVVIELHPQG